MNTEKTTPEQKTSARNSESSGPRPSRSSSIIIALLGMGSFAIGFLLVHFALPAPPPDADAHKNNTCASTEPSPVTHDTEPNLHTEEIEAPEPDQSADAPGGLPEVPPAPTPDGLRIDGAPLYYKCWADGDDAAGSKDCDRLRVLEKRMHTRLYVVHECKLAHGSESDHGLLSLGANLDFASNSITFWSGPSSTLANAAKIGNCIRQKLAGIPLFNIDHKYGKYRLFFSVDFFDPKQRERQLAQKRQKGRQVKVIKDKVNVRETPVDGASIGRISSDSTVTFLKKSEAGDWCLVLTPNNREGWMICSALGL